MAGTSLSPQILHLLALFLITLQISLSYSAHIPMGFSCTKAKPRQQWPTYSMPTDKIRVDLIHIFCGQIKTNGAASGFHARPGNTDPPSALTKFAVQVRKPHDKYDYAIYSSPSVYDINLNKYVKKDGYSHIWPTALHMEDVTEIIINLVDQCRPPENKSLCVIGFVMPGSIFDVKIIIEEDELVGKVARSAYPVKLGACSNASDKYFHKCPFRF